MRAFDRTAQANVLAWLLVFAAALTAAPATSPAQTTGPGDPTTPYVAPLGLPEGIAAGSTGELYVADTFRIIRVDPTGTVTTYFQEDPSSTPYVSYFIDLVVEGSGDLLVVGRVPGPNSRAFADRITSSGQRSQFAQLPADAYATAITIGPDGDVWVALELSSGTGEIHRYDSFGAFKAAIHVTRLVWGLAFSPAGELFFIGADDPNSSRNAVYKIVGGAPQLVYQSPSGVSSLAFDKGGYLYVTSPYGKFSTTNPTGPIILLDPAGQVVNDPFASSNLGGSLINLAFLRAANGAMTTRLLAAYRGGAPLQQGPGGIVEMNPAGMRAEGFRIGAVPSITTASLDLLGGLQLDPVVLQQLDAQGNNNGRFDVGDFRAYLRANGQLPVAAVTVRKERP